jgi:hypothetical protein
MIKDTDHKFNQLLMFFHLRIVMFHQPHILIKFLLLNKFEKNQEEHNKIFIIHDKFNQQQIKEYMKETIKILEVYLLKIVMVFSKRNLLLIKDNNQLIKDNNQN